ncbi:MAG: MFS transporter [Clostridium sp.]|uniref:MFS transporter n=1 Tax=Clostridium sp. TaxID=1506 RepID=UPI003EE590AD
MNTINLTPSEKKRWTRNCIFFIIGFFFLGIISGVSMDAFVTYLSLKAPNVVTAYSTYVGIGLFASSIIILLIPKIGYKKVLLPFPILIIISILGIIYINTPSLIALFTIIFLIGINVANSVLAPMLSSYTTLQNRTKIFSIALYTNVIGTALATLLDGNSVVYFFSRFMHIDYVKANTLTSAPSKLSHFALGKYLLSFKVLLFALCIIALLAFFATLFLKEKKSDYRDIKIDSDGNVIHKTKEKFNWDIFRHPTTVVWLIYMFLIGFGASLVIPYLPIFLENFLHIGRGTISILLALQYVASVLFMMISPKLEKKFGSVVSLAVLFSCSFPLFIIIVNGGIFGTYIVFGVGLALFLRSGFANACSPILQALPMSFVKKSERAAYNAAVSVLQALGYILGGLFTKYILFVHASGYKEAYYITGIMYLVASIIMFFVLFKKYNRYTEQVSLDEEVTSIDEPDSITI